MATQYPREVNQIDRNVIEEITRQVIAQLRSNLAQAPADDLTATSQTNRIASAINEKVISEEVITKIPRDVSVALIRHDAVLTPSAIDESKRRQLEITRLDDTPVSGSSNPTTSTLILDRDNSIRANSLANQLHHRGLPKNHARIVLSDTPAKELMLQINEHQQIATIVGSIEEVKRFSAELDLTCWILDMKRLNFMSAVNVATAIARIGSPES